jgi:large subunit ribosomal protein L24
MMHIKKNDKIKVIVGRDKGKEASVIEVLPAKGKVLVKDVGVVTRHTKARRQGEVAGIKKEEALINISNVMPICSACSQPTRINVKVLDNKKTRMCNNCKEII